MPLPGDYWLPGDRACPHCNGNHSLSACPVWGRFPDIFGNYANRPEMSRREWRIYCWETYYNFRYISEEEYLRLLREQEGNEEGGGVEPWCQPWPQCISWDFESYDDPVKKKERERILKFYETNTHMYPWEEWLIVAGFGSLLQFKTPIIIGVIGLVVYLLFGGKK